MKPLDQWARDFGYSDFDTFIRAGGSLTEARRDIEQRSRTLDDALNHIEALQLLLPLEEAETEDEEADSDNAQIQGAELG